MNLIEEVERWHERDEHQRIVDAIEALPEDRRSPQLVSALARAYNNLAGVGDTALFRRAIALLESVEEELQDDHSWNFRMAYAYYYLDQEGPALHYFERALEAKPGDEDTRELIADCRSRLAFPQFEKTFRERTAGGWESFQAGEAELRAMMDAKQVGEKLVGLCADLLAPAFSDISFELGFNGSKYELILTPEGSRAKLFQLVYFQRRAPEKVLEHWDVHVGRRPAPGFGLRMFGREISAGDVRVWIQGPENGIVTLSCYCEELLPLLRENGGQAHWLLSILLDQTIGELAAMDLLNDFELLEAPCDGSSIPMDHLAEALRERGLELTDDPGRMLERYSAYEMEPDRSEDADLRMDVFAGVTLCVPLVNSYLQGDSELMDYFHQDGAVPGFLYYPLDGFADAKERGKAVLDFRDKLEAEVLERAGEDAVTFLGGASGIDCGYLDLIAWDLRKVLDAAVEVLEDLPVQWAAFHPFRREVGGVTLKAE